MPRRAGPGSPALAMTPIPAAVPRPARPLPAPSPRPPPAAKSTVSIRAASAPSPSPSRSPSTATKSSAPCWCPEPTASTSPRPAATSCCATSTSTGSWQNGLKGISITTANNVWIEDCTIFGFANQGIVDTRATGGSLNISNTTVRNNGQAGIATATTGGTLKVIIDNLRSFNNQFGVALSTNTNAVIKRSDLSNNTDAGYEGDGAEHRHRQTSIVEQRHRRAEPVLRHHASVEQRDHAQHDATASTTPAAPCSPTATTATTARPWARSLTRAADPIRSAVRFAAGGYRFSRLGTPNSEPRASARGFLLLHGRERAQARRLRPIAANSAAPPARC